jgi:hypothetical protein
VRHFQQPLIRVSSLCVLKAIIILNAKTRRFFFISDERVASVVLETEYQRMTHVVFLLALFQLNTTVGEEACISVESTKIQETLLVQVLFAVSTSELKTPHERRLEFVFPKCQET